MNKNKTQKITTVSPSYCWISFLRCQMSWKSNILFTAFISSCPVYFSDRSIWLLALITLYWSALWKAIMTSLPISKPSQNASYPLLFIFLKTLLTFDFWDISLSWLYCKTVLSACSLSLAGSSLTSWLLIVRVLTVPTWSNSHPSLHWTDLSIYMLKTPRLSLTAKDKIICWFHHPNNHISSVTWKCPSKQDYSPLWKALVQQAGVYVVQTLLLYGRHHRGSDLWHWVLLRCLLTRVHLFTLLLFSCHVQMFFLLSLTDILTLPLLFLDKI